LTVTDGTLLGGLVHYCQPAIGHRSGIEPVLLAASVAARPGARVLEGGSGAGAGLLCLAARIPDLVGVGVEIAPEPLACAEANALANQATGVRFVAGDLTDPELDIGGLDARQVARFDHAIANPPWHPPGTASPDSSRELARRAPHAVFALWAAALAAPLRHHGSLTLIFPAAALPEALAAITSAGCGSPAIFPLWPKPGQPAKLMLLRAIKGGRGPCRLLAGLVLHEADGHFTPAAEGILRHGTALSWDRP
jgi:tRNA1Val (adenine37-N6)-methyltransferase